MKLGTAVAFVLALHGAAAVCLSGYTLFEDLAGLEGKPTCLRLVSTPATALSARSACALDHPRAHLATFASTSTAASYSVRDALKSLFASATTAPTALVLIGGQQNATVAAAVGGVAAKAAGWMWDDGTAAASISALWSSAQPEYVPHCPHGVVYVHVIGASDRDGVACGP